MKDETLHQAVRFDDDWTLAEEHVEASDYPYLETIFAQANGYLGMRGVLEVATPEDAESEAYFVCQGVFDQQPGRYETDELVNLPDWLPIELSIDGASPGDDQFEVVDDRRVLRLDDGALERHTTVRVRGEQYALRFERFLSQANRHLAAWRMELVAPKADGRLRLRWGYVTDRTNRGTVHFEEVDRATGAAMVAHHIRTLESGIDVSQAQAGRLRIDGERAVAAACERISEPGFAGVEWELDLAAGERFVVERVNAVCTSRDRAEGAASRRCVEEAFAAAEAGFEVLGGQNRAAWAEKWSAADVRIEGDRTADRALRYCLFQLMASNLDDDERTAIGAKALSGPGYRGHFFWDTEMFMAPFFAHTNPTAARNLVAFRHRILPGARDLAREMGCEGARWPWEATRDGREQCPDWLPTEDGGEVRIVTGEQEDHISADVAWGAWYYRQVTGDEEFWRGQGLELMVEAARFWQSRVEWNEGRERFEILGVMGPDENHECVDNNAYTNYLAAWTLRVAAEEVERARAGRSWAERLDELAVSDSDLQAWMKTAEAMYLPLEEETGLIPQHDGFLEEVREGADVEPIKQADVLMLLRIFPDLLPLDDQRRNFEFYEPLTEHGSSLSPSVHAQLALQLGLWDDARRYLRQALLVDLADTHGNTAEGLHAAALGGAWMAVVQGVGGLWIDSTGRLQLSPSMPDSWERLGFSVRLHGGVLDCVLDSLRVRLTYRHPRGDSLAITVAGSPVRVHSERCLELPLSSPPEAPRS